MNKELEALKRLYEHLDGEDLSGDDYYINDAHKDFDIIAAALKEVSGEDRVLLNHIKKGKLHPLTTKCYQELLKKQRALNIIKEKSVSVGILQMSPNLDAYNNRIIEHPNVIKTKKLTQEEYDLLRGVLCDECL